MKIKYIRLVALFFIYFFSISDTQAYWVWSPTESKFLPKNEVKQEPEQKTSATSTSASDSVNPILVQEPEEKQLTQPVPEETEGLKKEESKPQEKVSVSKSNVPQKTSWLQMLMPTKEKLLKGKFLKPNSAEPQQVPQGQFWSPSQGKFISLPTSKVPQATAEELFQKALKLRKEKGKDKETIRLLQFIVKYYNQSAYAPEAQFLIATIFEENDKPLRAAAEFKKVVREFPRSERLEESIEHLYKIGNFFLTGEKQKLMGIAIIPVYSKAADIFKFIVEQAPYGPFGDLSQLRLGIAYRKMANFNDAVSAFQTLIANYPTSPLIDEAHYQLAETSYELSQNANRDQVAISQASSHLKEFIQQYGTSSLAERAKILKQRLDEQDAEKNYRIGLYYEKQGSADSALIYYEDVADRYAQTVFGKKAAKRVEILKQPVQAMKKGEASIQQRIAEVHSMLQALEQEEHKKGKKAVSETGDTKNQLKQELTSLSLAQKQFKHEARDNFSSRKRALKEREKNLREKFRTFKSRKKALSKNPSPELQEVFDKWQASLLSEQEEVAHERQTINTIKGGFKTEKHLGWLPSPKPKREGVVKYDQKKWNRLQKERINLLGQQKRNEQQLRDIESEFNKLGQQEVGMINQIKNLDQFLPADLVKEKINLEQKKKELDESIQSFGQTQKEFETKFGSAFLKSLGDETKFEKLASVRSLLSGGADLDQVLADLQSQKTSLSETWILEKEKFATMTKAFEQAHSQLKQVQEKVPAEADNESMDQAQQSRLLKKKMKYLEREIRSRVDQIQDWNRENAKRMKKLKQLIRQKNDEGLSPMSKAANKVFSPAKGTYKLTKAFFFGLENNDQKLMEQADQEMKKSETEGKAQTERMNEIRELQEEIELQSILIRGRTAEIKDFQDRLATFQKQAKTISGFSYQSLLVERIPTDLEHTIDTAKKLMGVGGDREADFVKKLETQNNHLGDLEQKIVDIGNQIEAVQLAIEQKKAASSKQKAKVTPSIAGNAETLPQEGNLNQNEEKNKSESKLIQMKADVNIRKATYQRAEVSYHGKLLSWFETAGEKLKLKIPKSLKTISSRKLKLQNKKVSTQKSLSEILKKETAVVRAQKNVLDQKLNDFEKRLEKSKNPSDSTYQSLMSEMNETRQTRDSLIHDLTTLQSS